MSNTQLNVDTFEQKYREVGLIETIRWFCNVVYEQSNREYRPDYSFGHVVLDDYNLYDVNILSCLGELAQSMRHHVKEMRKGKANPHGEDWETYQFWDIMDAIAVTVLFMGWMLSIPEDAREKAKDNYWGVD